LLAAAGAAGAAWGRLGIVAAALAWAWVPGAHAAQRALGLPDTLHPNTWGSILKLATFALAVTAVGTGSGLLVRRLAGGRRRPAEPPFVLSHLKKSSEGGCV